jgi:hypothetical protein
MSERTIKKKFSKALTAAKKAAVKYADAHRFVEYWRAYLFQETFEEAVEVGIDAYNATLNFNIPPPLELTQSIAITGITVATEADRLALLKASEAFHNLPWIDTDMPLVNTMAHLYQASNGFVTTGKERVYYSDRGLPLAGSSYEGCDVITVELYLKWYSPYVIKTDGTVEPVDTTQAPDSIQVLDHNIHPDLLRWVAKQRTDAGVHTEVSGLALELAAGRWAMDVQELFGER